MKLPEANRISNINEYYFSKKLQEIREIEASGQPIINLGIGSPDLSPSDASVNALMRSALEPANHAYQSYKGVAEFRAAISAWYNRMYAVEINPNTEVLPLLGSKEGIFHITMAFVNPGDDVLIANPAYPTYESVSKIAGANVIHYDLKAENDWNIDIEQLKSMDLSNVKIMWMNSLHMPTGSSVSDEVLAELITLAKQNNFLIVNDNPYSLILNENPSSLMQLDGAFDVALELNSMSKSHHMAGWRVGWMLGNEQFINSVLKFKSNIDSGMFLPVQHAAIEALNNSDLWHRTQNTIYKKRKVIVHATLDALNCTYNKDQSGLFVWARIPEYFENSELFVEEILQKAKVFVAPGFIFGTNGDKYIRFSLSNSEEKLEAAFRSIQSNFRKIKKTA